MKGLVLGGKNVFLSVQLTDIAIIVWNEGNFKAVCVAELINTQQL